MTATTSQKNSAIVTVHLKVNSAGDSEVSSFDLFTLLAPALAAIHSFVFEQMVVARASLKA